MKTGTVFSFWAAAVAEMQIGSYDQKRRRTSDPSKTDPVGGYQWVPVELPKRCRAEARERFQREKQPLVK